MRTVVSSQEVAHLWANQAQPEARNAGGTLYFRDSTIYSYGSHFPMGRHVDGIVLFTTNTYSPTTSKHLSWTRYACNYLTVYDVPDVLACNKTQHRANFEHYRKRYESLIIKASRARKYASLLLTEAEAIRTEANEYSRFFKIRVQLKPADIDTLKTKADKQRKAELKAEKKRAIKRDAELLKHVAKWRANETYSSPWGYSQTILRLSADGENVQTSRGVTFPADHARRALPILHRCVSRGRVWQQNGKTIHLGNYRLDRISANGDVKAGCHFIKYAEIQRLEVLLNGGGAA